MSDEINPEATSEQTSGDALQPAREVVARELGEAPPPAVIPSTAGPVETAHGTSLVAPSQEERVVAAISHLLAFASWTAAGLVVNVILFLVWQQRSAYVRFQAAQAIAYGLVVAAAVWVVGVLVSGSVVLLCLTPLFLVVLLPLVVYPLFAATQTLSGRDFRYLVVGDLVEGLLRPRT